MFMRARHRRAYGALPSAADQPRPLRMLLILLIGAILVVWIGWKGLQALGILNQVQRMRADFTVLAAPVNVSIEGGDLREAQDAKLYTGDRVVTNSGGRAQMSFFDGSSLGIDQLSDLTIENSDQGTKSSALALNLQKGQIVWTTPTAQSFSGSITRTVVTPLYTASLPTNTKAVFTEREIQVLSADGIGITVKAKNAKDSVSIGEGQQLSIPDGTIAGSLYTYRSLLDPMAVREAAQFAVTVPGTQTGSGQTVANVTGSGEIISLTEPTDNQIVKGTTVEVKGTAGPTVQKVRINGYEATIDPEDGSFTQELAVTQGSSMDVLVEGLDGRGVVIGQQHRTVRLQVAKLDAPTITSPAPAGSVYRTQKTKFTISGTAPAGAAGIVVNDYRLQLFKPGDTTWAYLVNKDLGNFQDGTNTITVYAVDAAGGVSSGATITILLEAGTEGVVTGQTASASSEQPQVDEKTLPQNSPTAAGTLSITAPTAGLPYTSTGSEVLIEGKTSPQTDSIWVNGYKLRLYTAGKTYWNYYAREQYGTLKKGKNTYVVNARDAKGNILDTLTYEIDY